MNNVDKQYFDLVNLILEKGRKSNNRTGVPTLSYFGAQARFNLQEGFPLLTTKKVFYKGMIHELLWFISGNTNIKYLVNNNVHIWDADAYRNYKTKWEEGAKWCENVGTRSHLMLSKEEFIEKIAKDDEFAAKWGELGMGTYGSTWRKYPYYAEKPEFEYGSPTGAMEAYQGEVDQLGRVVNKLKTNPEDRRILLDSWHAYWAENCTLAPCHVLYSFNTEELTTDERINLWNAKYPEKGISEAIDLDPEMDAYITKCLDSENFVKRRLNCLFYCRSQDAPLGTVWNWPSAALLTHMIAQVVNMAAGDLIWVGGNCHIYENQMDGIKEQLTREPRNLPSLWLNPEVKDLFKFKYEDIRIEGYDPHPAIKMPLSV